jgi:death-on-curing protein
LESAAFQPRNTWYFAQGDLFDIAAAYAYHISQSQAFLDGNKRTGLATALVFLRLNGITLRRNTDMLHGAMIAMSGQRIGKDELAAIFRQISR